MTKREFLDTLGLQLQGELSQAQIDGHLHYYSEYIAEAVASGRSEREVIEELGSPVLIARTLLDAAASSGYEENPGRADYDYGSGSQWREEDTEDSYYGGKVHTWNVNPLVLKWGIPIALILILFLFFSLVGSVVAIVVRYFVPIVLILVVIHLLRKR